MNKKINFLNMSRKEIIQFILSLGEKYFCANQIMEWIYKYFCQDFYKMTNIKKNIREKLNEIAEIRAPKLDSKYFSIDGTIKWIIKTADKQKIESIYIPKKNRSTICISSQVGCAMKCAFCATARQGFNRNLQTYEIIGQVWQLIKNIKNFSNLPITNIVVMGMGEPLLNISNLKPAIEIMTDNFGFGLSRKHITISTCGIAPAIEKIRNLNISLAISLHASNNEVRNYIMPINKKYNMENILSKIKLYLKKSCSRKEKIMIEYVMIKGINDKLYHAKQLIEYLKDIPCKINLIPLNSFPGITYKCSSMQTIKNFSSILKKRGFTVIIREKRGNDIYASCGQLSGKVFDRTKKFIKN